MCSTGSNFLAIFYAVNFGVIYCRDLNNEINRIKFEIL